MATAATVDRSVRALAGQIQTLSARLGDLEAGVRTDQLGDSSIQNGYLSIYDDSGVVRAILGKQADGTYVGGNSINNPLPPPVPKAPTVTSVLAGVKVTGNGSMTGTWPVDFARVNVYAQDHASPTPALVGTLASDDDVLILAPLPAGSTWDVWLTSVNLSGTESTVSTIASGSPNQVVSTDLLDGIVTTLKLAAGAVTTAKIAADAVTITQIADNSVSTPQLVAGSVQTATLAADSVSAGKIAADAVTAREILASSITANELAANSITATQITAGAVTAAKLVANMVLATRIIAGNATGARVEMHPTSGLQAYKSDGTTRTFWIDASTGNAYFMGTIATAQTGSRIELNTNGTAPDTMRLYQGSNYAIIFADPAGATAGVFMAGGTSATNVGKIGAYPAEGFTSWTDGSVSRSAISCTALSARVWGGDVGLEADDQWGSGAVNFTFRDASGNIQAARSLSYVGGGSNEPVWRGIYNDLQIVFAGSGLVVQNSGGGSRPVIASAFTVSSQTAKKDLQQIRLSRIGTHREAVKALRPQAWRYLGEWDGTGAAPAPPQVTYTEQVRDEVGRLLTNPDGSPMETVITTDGAPVPVAPLRWGLVAEDVAGVLPEAVRAAPDVPGGLIIGTGELLAALWAALSTEIEQNDRRNSGQSIGPPAPTVIDRLNVPPPAPAAGALLYEFAGGVWVVAASGVRARLA